MSRVLVTVQRPEDAGEAFRAVAGYAASGACVTIVGVTPPLPLCAHWVGLTGVAHCPGLREELVDEVVALVRSTVEAMPPGVGVSHHVAVQGWRDPCLLGHLARGCFDEVVLVASPRRRRDRRALEEAAAAGDATLVMHPRAAEPDAAPALPSGTTAAPALS